MVKLNHTYQVVKDYRFRHPYKLSTVTFTSNNNGVLEYYGDTASGIVYGVMVLRNAEELIGKDQ